MKLGRRILYPWDVMLVKVLLLILWQSQTMDIDIFHLYSDSLNTSNLMKRQIFTQILSFLFSFGICHLLFLLRVSMPVKLVLCVPAQQASCPFNFLYTSGTQSWVWVTCLNFGKLLCTKNHADQSENIHPSHDIPITSNNSHQFWKLIFHGFLFETAYYIDGQAGFCSGTFFTNLMANVYQPNGWAGHQRFKVNQFGVQPRKQPVQQPAWPPNCYKVYQLGNQAVGQTGYCVPAWCQAGLQSDTHCTSLVANLVSVVYLFGRKFLNFYSRIFPSYFEHYLNTRIYFYTTSHFIYLYSFHVENTVGRQTLHMKSTSAGDRMAGKQLCCKNHFLVASRVHGITRKFYCTGLVTRGPFFGVVPIGLVVIVLNVGCINPVCIT
ncbi:putative signal peptide protein [Puccinia sorghi]|uniref:Putative signal peptide protein n=1 Tax=Puccinia sorghi TaxID=27349 RepID=A0A0L6UEG7_9BASI|nr:putative signal peptide protein [Puccinia sorghi]